MKSEKYFDNLPPGNEASTGGIVPFGRLSAFTLIEMLVGTAIFALMIVLLLQLTSGLMSNANRIDENLTVDQEVRVVFDLMRRDLAQARIGTNQNQFYGTTNRLSFVSSTSRLKTDFVSDQRLVTYFVSNRALYRTVIDPTLANYSSNTWNPILPGWWANPANTDTNNAEAILEGVYPNDPWDFFIYVNRADGKTVTTLPTSATNPPGGVVVALAVAGKRARARAGASPITDTNQLKQFKYDIELNIPPVFNP